MAEKFTILVVEHQKNAGIGQLATPLVEAGMTLDIVGPDTGKDIPDSLDGYSGVIVLGGATGPLDDDKAPWLPATRERMSEALEEEVPLFGICLGGQLLTTVAGGSVTDAKAGPEVGLNSVQFSAEALDDPLFSVLGSHVENDLPVLQWHWLESVTMPVGAVTFASSERSMHQAYRVRDTAWGVQFHPEGLTSTAIDWSNEDRHRLAPLGLDRDEVVAAVREAEPKLRELWAPLATRFAEIVRDRTSLRSSSLLTDQQSQ